MIFIDDQLESVKNAKKRHFEIVSKYLIRNHSATDEITTFIHDKDNLKHLLSGKPQALININNEFYKYISNYSEKSYNQLIKVDIDTHWRKRSATQKRNVTRYKNLHSKLEKVINYENWFTTSDKHYDYEITRLLNRTTCTYCNRSYTSTMKTKDKKKLMRPQFDHWFPKSKYPLLALSFYNLIPSCSICNSTVKGTTDFQINSHTHPYLDDIIDQFNFDYNHHVMIDQFKISIHSTDDRISNMLTDLHLEEMYNSHHSELSDLIQIRQAYSEKYLDSLKSIFPLANLNEKDMYRLAFGTELNKKDFHKRPMSKFKNDILKELRIIKT